MNERGVAFEGLALDESEATKGGRLVSGGWSLLEFSGVIWHNWPKAPRPRLKSCFARTLLKPDRPPHEPTPACPRHPAAADAAGGTRCCAKLYPEPGGSAGDDRRGGA